MKQILLFTISCFITASVWAQKTALQKVHAYVRQSTPGAVPKVVAAENGNAVKKMATVLVNYSIYAEIKKGNTIKVTRLWIDGQAYKARTEIVAETPVLFKQPAIGNQNQTDTLVPKTSNMVWKLVPDRMQSEKLKYPANYKGNALLVEYIWKGNKYYYAVKEWKKLAPLILQ